MKNSDDEDWYREEPERAYQMNAVPSSNSDWAENELTRRAQTLDSVAVARR